MICYDVLHAEAKLSFVPIAIRNKKKNEEKKIAEVEKTISFKMKKTSFEQKHAKTIKCEKASEDNVSSSNKAKNTLSQTL